MPLLAVGEDRGVVASGLRLYHLEGRVLLRADNARDAPLDDASFFACDLGQGRAQKLLVIDGHRRDHCQRRLVHNIRRIETPAKPDFKQGILRRSTGKRQQCGAGCDLEICNAFAIVRGIAFIQQFSQRGFGNQLSGKANAFVKTREMR